MALDEVAGDERAEAAGAAGDQDGALGVDRARDASSTSLPTFLPSRRWRKASGAWRMSQVAIGEWRRAPLLEELERARRASRPVRLGPASVRSKAR